jgi:PadR family transcriptional regulator, regulatory protein PadR
MASRRRTQARVAIAIELIRRKEADHWGYELSRNSGVSAGSMYPFLNELLESGCLVDGWEDPATTHGRPPRRYYRLTEDGIRALTEFIQAAPAPSRRSKVHTRPATQTAK